MSLASLPTWPGARALRASRTAPRWRSFCSQLLFAAVRSVLNELLLDPRYLGAQPAYIAALHTWGRSLSLHPHIRARYGYGEGVAAYLARYLKRGPLKNAQRVGADANSVCFRYPPHRDEEDSGSQTALMRLTPQAFLDRYIAHMAPPRLQCVRGYGLYGSHQHAALDRTRATLGQPPVEETQPLKRARVHRVLYTDPQRRALSPLQRAARF